MIRDSARWSHDIHYHPVLLGALPARVGRVLDVGCGEGMLARRLRGRAGRVVAIDVDGPILRLAQGHPAGADIDYVLSDVLADPFPAASFDAVVAVASLHHLGTASGLRAMCRLLRPGGTLGVIGLARSRGPIAGLTDLAAAVGTRLMRARRGWWHQPARTRRPEDTYG